MEISFNNGNKKNKGSKHSAENYRPISLTSIACKIIESFIRDSMVNYLKANDILSNEQFGFLRRGSTVLQLLKVVDKWTEIMDKGGVIDVIYCDFQKTFDTVPYKRLLEILVHYGITDPVLSWVQDFLSNRRQQILVNGCKSEIFEVISGVPQGSVLGPLLFIIYLKVLNLAGIKFRDFAIFSLNREIKYQGETFQVYNREIKYQRNLISGGFSTNK